MDALRWILLGVAVVIIAAIYFFSRGRNKEQSHSPLDAANDASNDGTEKSAGDEWVHGVGPVRVLAQEDVDVEAVKNISHLSTQSKTPVKAPDWDSLYAESAEKNTTTPPEKTVSDSVDELSLNSTSQSDSSLNTSVDDTQVPDQEIKAPENTSAQSVENNDAAVNESADAAIDDVISVYVLASDEEPLIHGDKILSASYALKLEHGEMRIFHRYTDTPEHEILFSMANIQNPGWFDVDRMNDLSTRGMSFFMQVNLVDHPSRVLDDMLICAHQMATMLGGVLCNSQREPLDEAFTITLREKVKYLEKIKTQSA